jgi:hypothetical protein
MCKRGITTFYSEKAGDAFIAGISEFPGKFQSVTLAAYGLKLNSTSKGRAMPTFFSPKILKENFSIKNRTRGEILTRERRLWN